MIKLFQLYYSDNCVLIYIIVILMSVLQRTEEHMYKDLIQFLECIQCKKLLKSCKQMYT